jgi:hypothetical protein
MTSAANCHQFKQHRQQILPPVFLVLLIPGGKFATYVNNTGGKLPPVSTTPAASLPPV